VAEADSKNVARIATIRPSEIAAWCFGRLARAFVTVPGVLKGDYANGWKMSVTVAGADPTAGPGPTAAFQLNITDVDKCLAIVDLNGGSMDLEAWVDIGNDKDGTAIGWVMIDTFTVTDRAEFEVALGKRAGYLRPVNIGGGMGPGQAATIWVGPAL